MRYKRKKSGSPMQSSKGALGTLGALSSTPTCRGMGGWAREILALHGGSECMDVSARNLWGCVIGRPARPSLTTISHSVSVIVQLEGVTYSRYPMQVNLDSHAERSGLLLHACIVSPPRIVGSHSTIQTRARRATRAMRSDCD